MTRISTISLFQIPTDDEFINISQRLFIPLLTFTRKISAAPQSTVSSDLRSYIFNRAKRSLFKYLLIHSEQIILADVHTQTVQGIKQEQRNTRISVYSLSHVQKILHLNIFRWLVGHSGRTANVSVPVYIWFSSLHLLRITRNRLEPPFDHVTRINLTSNSSHVIKKENESLEYWRIPLQAPTITRSGFSDLFASLFIQAMFFCLELIKLL